MKQNTKYETLIDTHAHVNFKDYRSDGDEVIRRAFDGGVQMINVGAEYTSSQRAVEYAEKYETGVWAAIGLHPIHLFDRTYAYQTEHGEEVIKTKGENFEYEKYLELAKKDKVVAIGEIGLDYHHFEPGDVIGKMKDKQRKVFESFIDLANEVKKPIIVHCWDAYPEILESLERKPVIKKGIIHSFIGSHKTAKQFIALGYKIGLNGIVTYSESYDRLIREISLDHIVLETDCPYLPPKPLPRDARNEPVFVTHVAKKISAVLGVSIEEVAWKTSENVKAVFAIDH